MYSDSLEIYGFPLSHNQLIMNLHVENGENFTQQFILINYSNYHHKALAYPPSGWSSEQCKFGGYNKFFINRLLYFVAPQSMFNAINHHNASPVLLRFIFKIIRMLLFTYKNNTVADHCLQKCSAINLFSLWLCLFYSAALKRKKSL